MKQQIKDPKLFWFFFALAVVLVIVGVRSTSQRGVAVEASEFTSVCPRVYTYIEDTRYEQAKTTCEGTGELKTLTTSGFNFCQIQCKLVSQPYSYGQSNLPYSPLVGTSPEEAGRLACAPIPVRIGNCTPISSFGTPLTTSSTGGFVPPSGAPTRPTRQQVQPSTEPSSAAVQQQSTRAQEETVCCKFARGYHYLFRNECLDPLVNGSVITNPDDAVLLCGPKPNTICCKFPSGYDYATETKCKDHRGQVVETKFCSEVSCKDMTNEKDCINNDCTVSTKNVCSGTFSYPSNWVAYCQNTLNSHINRPIKDGGCGFPTDPDYDKCAKYNCEYHFVGGPTVCSWNGSLCLPTETRPISCSIYSNNPVVCRGTKGCTYETTFQCIE